MGSKYPDGLRRTAPTDATVTDYDRAHLQDYIRLLDARAAGMSGDDMCRAILEIDPAAEGAQATLRSHLERASWMSSEGFRQI